MSYPIEALDGEFTQLTSSDLHPTSPWCSDGADDHSYMRPTSPSPHYFPAYCEYTTPLPGPGICRLPDKILGRISFMACLDDVFRLSLTCSRMYRVFSEDYWRYRAQLSNINLYEVPNAKIQLFGPIKACCYHCSSPLLYNWEEMYIGKLITWMGREHNIFPEAVTHATLGVYFCNTCINEELYYHPIHEIQLYQLDLSETHFGDLRHMETPRGRFYSFRDVLTRLIELNHPVTNPAPLGDQYDHLRLSFWQALQYQLHLDQLHQQQLYPIRTQQGFAKDRPSAVPQSHESELMFDSGFETSALPAFPAQNGSSPQSGVALSRAGEVIPGNETDASLSTGKVDQRQHSRLGTSIHEQAANLVRDRIVCQSVSKSHPNADHTPQSIITRCTTKSSLTRDGTPNSLTTASVSSSMTSDQVDGERFMRDQRKKEEQRIRQAQQEIMQEVKAEQLMDALEQRGYVVTPGFENDPDVRRWISGDWIAMRERGIYELEDVVRTLLYRWSRVQPSAHTAGESVSKDGCTSVPCPQQDVPFPEINTSALAADLPPQAPPEDFFLHGTGPMSLFEKNVHSDNGGRTTSLDCSHSQLQRGAEVGVRCASPAGLKENDGREEENVVPSIQRNNGENCTIPPSLPSATVVSQAAEVPTERLLSDEGGVETVEDQLATDEAVEDGLASGCSGGGEGSSNAVSRSSRSDSSRSSTRARTAPTRRSSRVRSAEGK